jgi:hypothetical protein
VRDTLTAIGSCVSMLGLLFLLAASRDPYSWFLVAGKVLAGLGAGLFVIRAVKTGGR